MCTPPSYCNHSRKNYTFGVAAISVHSTRVYFLLHANSDSVLDLDAVLTRGRAQHHARNGTNNE